MDDHTYTTRTTCRVCGGSDLAELFTLGEQYVNDFLPDGEQPRHKCPITIQLCNDCTLVQAKHTAPQDFLYHRFYWYRSGVTETMRAALRDVTRRIEQTVDLRDGDIVLDIGSNDGTLLRTYSNDELIRVGVEPARNLMEEGSRGLDMFIGDFWSQQVYESRMRGVIQEHRAKVITAIGMFYDLEDPNQFVADVAACLRDDGVFVAQLMCLRNMIDSQDVGNLAHEHLEFYSLRSLEYLFERHSLEIFDVEENQVNGGSYRIFARRKSTDSGPKRDSFYRALSTETGLNRPHFYTSWFEQVEQNKRDCMRFVEDARSRGKTVWVYGASTKGNVILQYYGLDHRLLGGAVDRSPEKWGKYTVGTGVRIYSNEEGRAKNPDYFLVLPYAFIDEFVELEREWRERGGRFIVPLPRFHVV